MNKSFFFFFFKKRKSQWLVNTEGIGFKEKTRTLQFGVKNGGMLLPFPEKMKERIKERSTFSNKNLCIKVKNHVKE